jgi:hypothetical protein
MSDMLLLPLAVPQKGIGGTGAETGGQGCNPSPPKLILRSDWSNDDDVLADLHDGVRPMIDGDDHDALPFVRRLTRPGSAGRNVVLGKQAQPKKIGGTFQDSRVGTAQKPSGQPVSRDQ